ncbi:hypothetical protein RZ72_05895, partial [Apilactobacillus kunkeei]
MNVPLFVLLDIAEMSSSYYDACQREYEVDDQEVISEIKVIRNKFKDYGYRRVTIELKRRGYNINHKKVLR